MSVVDLKSISGITSITTPASDNQLTLHTNNTTERIRITSAGEIGIGTAVPTDFVDIMQGSDDQNIVIVRGADDISEYAGVGVYDGNAVFTGGGVDSTSTGIVFRTAASGVETERLRIEYSGRIGINTTSSKVNGVHIYDKHLAINEGYPITWLQPNSSSSRGRMTVDSGGNYLFQFGSGNDEKIRFKSDGKVGIGTVNPRNSAKLDVHNPTSNGVFINYDGQSNTEYGLRIESNGSGGNFESDFVNGTTALLDLYANSSTVTGGDLLVARTQSSTPVFLVKGNGRVGINNTSPSKKLEIATTGTSGEGILLKATDSTYPSVIGDANRSGAGLFLLALQGYWNGKRVSEITCESGPDTTNKDDGIVTIRTRNHGDSSPQDRLVVKEDGNVGINVTDPDTILEINKGSEGRYLKIGGDNASNGRALTFTSSTGNTGSNGALHTISATSGNGAIALDTAGTERLRIASDGKILMGVAANNGPAAPLHIYGGSNTTPIIAFTRNTTHDDWQGAGIGMHDEGGTYKGALTFYTHSSSGTKNDSITEKVRITSTGYVGINEPAPACRLDVEDGASGGDGITEILRLNGSPNSLNDGIKINFARAGSSCGSIVLQKVNNNNTTDLIVSTRASNTVSESVRITGAGGVHIGNTFTAHTAADDLVLGASSGSNGMTILTGVATGSIFFNDGSGNEGVIQYVHTGSEHMRLKSEGYLKFDIGGGTNTVTINSSGNLLVNTTSSHAAKHAIHSGSTVGCAEFASALGGAGAACQVNVRVNTSASQGLYIRQGGSSQTIAGGNHCARFWNSENARMQFGVNNTERFRIESNGDLLATDTSIGSLSDSRLKKNIVDFTYDLTKFKQFKPRTFDWINPELHTDKTGIRGFVAQEIETVDSVLVGDYELFDETEDTKNPDLEIIKADDGTNKAKDAKLGSNDAMYISVIQQLITKIETLETEVAALKSS